MPCVLSLDLNVDVQDLRKVEGRLFHIEGAWRVKALSCFDNLLQLG